MLFTTLDTVDNLFSFNMQSYHKGVSDNVIPLYQPLDEDCGKQYGGCIN